MPPKKEEIKVELKPGLKYAGVDKPEPEVWEAGTDIEWTLKTNEGQDLRFKYLFIDGHQFSVNGSAKDGDTFKKVTVKPKTITAKDKKKDEPEDFYYVIVIEETNNPEVTYIVMANTGGPHVITGGNPVIRNR